MRKPGRPKASRLPRREQLRRAKRAQRARQRLAKIVELQLTLPAAVAAKLVAAKQTRGFVAQLDEALDALVVSVADYPQLKDLAWNRAERFIPTREAFQLYERNRRLLDAKTLDDRERALIARLETEFGRGEINA